MTSTEVAEAIKKTIAIIETAIMALEKINEVETQSVAETLRETHKHTDKLYMQFCEGE